MEVPLKVAYPPLEVAERTLTPGAVISGFNRLLPSAVAGPRLLKLAIKPVLAVIAPTVYEAA